MASPEFSSLLSEVQSLVPEARKGKVRNFGEMEGILPNTLVEAEVNLLQDYFRVQVENANGARNKAREMMRGLVKRTGWDEFENKHIKLLAIIDIAVRGETTQFSDVAFRMTAEKRLKKI